MFAVARALSLLLLLGYAKTKGLGDNGEVVATATIAAISAPAAIPGTGCFGGVATAGG